MPWHVCTVGANLCVRPYILDERIWIVRNADAGTPGHGDRGTGGQGDTEIGR